MQVANASLAQINRNAFPERSNRNRTDRQEDSSGSSRGYIRQSLQPGNMFMSLVSSPALTSNRSIVSGTNRNSFNNTSSRRQSISAYRSNSIAYSDEEKSGIMESASIMRATSTGRQSMASYLTGSSQSPIYSASSLSSLTSVMSEGIRQYTTMENGISTNFNILSRSASLYRTVGSLTANSGSLFNFI